MPPSLRSVGIPRAGSPRHASLRSPRRESTHANRMRQLASLTVGPRAARAELRVP